MTSLMVNQKRKERSVGNLGRIKKQFCSSDMDSKTKRRFFRGKSGRKNRETIRRAKLVATSPKEKINAPEIDDPKLSKE